MKHASLTCGDRVVVETVEVARTPIDRMRGLLGRSELAVGHGMFFPACRSIHTILMRFPLDVIFLSRDMCVVSIRRDIAPGRLLFGGRRAWATLEVQAGWLPVDALKDGAICGLGPQNVRP